MEYIQYVKTREYTFLADVPSVTNAHNKLNLN